MTAYTFNITCMTAPTTDWTFSETNNPDPENIAVKVGDTITFNFSPPVITNAFLTVVSPVSNPTPPFGQSGVISLTNGQALTIVSLQGNIGEETWPFTIQFDAVINGQKATYKVPDPELRVSSH